MSPGRLLMTGVVCAIAALSSTGGPLVAQALAVIRVGLVWAVEGVTIGTDGPLDVTDLATGRRDTQEGGRLAARASATGLDFGGEVYGDIVRLRPRAASAYLQVNGRPYRGLIEIRRTAAGRLTVINELDLEHYLYGVVRSEMDPRWPVEALRAQAIAARSLAVYSAGRFAAEGYDVRATTDTQVYGGVAAEDPRTTAAVDATRGQVMTFDGRAVFAAYHTDSGGATESSEFVWGTIRPYLRGVADPHSRDAPNHEWSLKVDHGTLAERLARAGRPVGLLRRVEVTATSPSGRVMALRLTGTGGAVEVRGTDFRNLLGVAVLRSTLFVVRPAGDDALEFAGRGYGHGVGMSQWGARGQAAAGRDAFDILRYYYAGVTIGQRP
jgi:stage II sporulation protein D